LTVEKAGDDKDQGPLSCTSPYSARSFNYGFSTTISTRLNETSDVRSIDLALDNSRKEEVDADGHTMIVAKTSRKKGRKS